MQFTAFLPVDPLPCPRPRVAVIKGHGVAYYPASYKKWVADFVENFKGLDYTRFENPVRVGLVFECRKARTSKLQTPGGDVDNYAKSVLDGLTKVGMWDDDKQVVYLTIKKQFAPADQPAGIHIVITEETP